MLHLIGIGYKKENITIEQKKIIDSAEEVFLEYYTSFYQNSVDELEKFLDKKIIVADRKLIENSIEEKILKPAKEETIALLVMGDPLIATTHADLLLRAKKLNIKTNISHNISILNLVNNTGLQSYKFGKITSIPFFDEKFMPRTPFMVYMDNHKMGAHSLFLLDLNPAQDDAYKGKEEYLKAHKAFEFLLDIPKLMVDEEEIEEKDSYCIDENTTGIICSKLGFENPTIVSGTIQDLIDYDKKTPLEPPICIIIPGDLHDIEEEFLNQFSISNDDNN